MTFSKRVFATIVLIVFGLANPGDARDCKLSKKFELKKHQRLAGTLKDSLDAPLAGFQLDLLKNGQIALAQTTDNDGAYDFGDVPTGKYRIRLRRGLGFCAPSVKCTADGCKINPVLKLGPQTTVVTHVFCATERINAPTG